MTELFSLGQKADMALEGSIGGDEGLQYIHDFANAVYVANAERWRAEGMDGAALAFFFAYLRQAADPKGDSVFQLRLARRNPKSKKTPQEIRDWENKHVYAALLVDMLVGTNRGEAFEELAGEEWTRDEALEHVAASWGIQRVNNITDAKKTQLYQRLKKRREK